MPNPKLETYKNKATDTVYDLTDANAQAMIAPEFSTSTAYVFGDYVIYEGKLYRFVANHSAGAWNSEHVSTEIEIGTNLNNKEDKVTFDSGDFNDQGVIDLTTGMGSRSVSLNKSTSPTDGDTKPITSGAVYNALTDKVDWASYAKTGAINRMPNTAVSSGIFTVNADGSIRINGTPTETAILIINDYGKWLENGKTYYLSGITGGAGDTFKMDITTSSEPVITATDGEVSFTVNNAADYRARIVVYANKTVDTTIYPMVADSPNAPYAPYAMTNHELTNEVTELMDEVGHAGKNKFKDFKFGTQGHGVTFTQDDTTKIITMNGTSDDGHAIRIGTFDFKANVPYILSGCPSGGGTESTDYWLGVYDGSTVLYQDTGDGVAVQFSSDVTYNVSMRIPNGADMTGKQIKVMVRDADIEDPTYYPHIMSIAELTEGVTNVHTFTPSNASITDFHGYYTINGKILTFVASYTKKGSSFTIGNIPNIQLASGLGESSSDVFVVGKGASGKDIVFFNQNGNLIFQEKETTDQTDKSYVQATLLLK